MTDYGAYDAGLPCKNPSCKSHGRPHPNCRCYAGLAKGGAVEPFCSQDRQHDPGCGYYAEGGEVQAPPQPLPRFAEDSASTLGHAAVDRGLLGLIRDVGKPKMMDPERHAKVLHEAKDQYAWRADPNENELPKTVGRRIGNAIADADHEKSASLIHGHPLVGGASKSNLHPIMERLAQPMMTEEPSPEGMRSAVDYLSSSIKGHGRLDDHMGKIFSQDKIDLRPDEGSREALRGHIDSAIQDPLKLLDSAGSVGHYLPVHGAQIGALAARSTNYLQSLKPMGSQNSPLDSISQVSPGDQAKYDRQLDIAQNPLLVLKHAETGMLQPQDLTTLQTLYPALHQSMVQKATEQMIKLGDKAKDIPYAKRQALGLLMGQALDSTMNPTVMQSIIKSQGPQQAQQQLNKQVKKQKPATGVELDQINKVNEMAETPLQRLQTKKD